MNKSSLALALLLSLISTPSFAQGETYSQLNLMHSAIESKSDQPDWTGAGIEGISGIKINNWLSLEASFNGNYYTDENSSVKVDALTYSFSAAPKITYHIIDELNIYGKLGGGITFIDIQVSGYDPRGDYVSERDWDSAFHLNVEAGVEYMLIPQLGFNLAYSKSLNSFKFPNNDTTYSQNFIKAGISYYY